MRRAIELAARGIGSTHPNPVVGCVITGRDGLPVGEGYHQQAGGPHAEVNALRMAGERARGGTAYVTLEPCNHTGRTGPCADALIEAGIARVVYAVPDPNAQAAGGAAKLRGKNIRVEQGVLQTEAEDVNHVWLHSVRTGRPFVTWKFATTLDGRSAAKDRSSKWITGAAARADVHRKRAECDAIAVGTQTVLVDDPELTVRDEHDQPLPRQPLRVVVGDREIPTTARVRNDRAPTLLLPTHDPAEVLRQLDDRQIRHLWLEGGPTLAAAFLRAGLVDQIVAYVAPALLGSGFSAVGDLGTESIDHLRRFTLADVTRLGDDVRLTLTPLGGK
ncbi:bifunctional diaminohydroxyphosphoribosylaminopyrimidine deaminase/5-amino-6-(5-phosphoribosylamino)uracil reductase RibD [Kribbella sp. NPDC051770]|uniref:bifunctional diaminohydroxyphosphoribosylaminopyrimidine deaminase/5-amino-6-(5-phosphoribosylamino)uracil reductase RibD n=1 Tax=Kribbella sp. NPDC051770 TaxID=3155413 RepID=UPI0034292D1C